MTDKHKILPSGWQLCIYDTATSTSDIIASHPALSEGLCIVAREQTKGRGRRGRQWLSAIDDGLYLSVALQPQRPQSEWPSLSFISALAMLDAINHLAPNLNAGLKWPNDILADGGKISGLLLEAHGDMILLGCGVNLRNAPPTADAAFAPADIASLSGHIITPEELADAFLERLYPFYDRWQISGFSAFYDLYKSKLLFLGQTITVRQDKITLTGKLHDIANDGALLLKTENDEILTVTAGDVNLMGRFDASGD